MKKIFYLISSLVLVCFVALLSVACTSGENCAHPDTKTVKENAVESTCTKKGSYETVEYCNVCNAVLSRKKVTEENLAEHKMQDGECSVCGYKMKCLHNEKTEVKENVIEATCLSGGSYDKVVRCKSCDKELSRTTEVVEKKVRHAMADGKCVDCGARESTPGLEFSMNAKDYGYTLISAFNCEAEEFIIDTYNGYPVTKIANASSYQLKSVVIGDSVKEIGRDAFFASPNIERVVIGDGVEKIREFAFAECTSLSEITIGSRVNIIDMCAFLDCSNLERVYINDIKRWCQISFVGSYTNPLEKAGNIYLDGKLVTDLVIPDGTNRISAYAFLGANITSAVIPGSVETVFDSAFLRCENLTRITIENGVEIIDNSAFEGCKSLKEIFIPDSVTYVGVAFYGCSSLEKIEVAENNSVYCSVDGNLYSKDKTEFLQYAFGKKETSFVIPADVTYIRKGAFSGCNFESIEFENTEGWQIYSWSDASDAAFVDVNDAKENAANLTAEANLYKTWRRIST